MTDTDLSTNISAEGETITQEHVDNMTDEMRAQLEAQNNKAEMPSKRDFFGKRTIGRRKMQLLGALQLQINRMNKKGINGEFALSRFTDWKGPIKTQTKKISGVISQLVNLEKQG